MKKIKKVAALLCAFMVVASFIPAAFAVEAKEEIIDLGDGFYAVVSVTQVPMTRSGDTVYGNKTGKVYQGSVQIGTATLGAEFDISGSTAKAIDAEITGSGQNGWGYKSGTTKLSGNKASGTAVFEMGSSTKSLVLTLTCSPNGTLS